MAHVGTEREGLSHGVQQKAAGVDSVRLCLATLLLFSWSFTLDYKYADVPHLLTDYMQKLMGFIIGVFVFDLFLSMPMRLFKVDRRKVSTLRIVCLLMLAIILARVYYMHRS